MRSAALRPIYCFELWLVISLGLVLCSLNPQAAAAEADPSLLGISIVSAGPGLPYVRIEHSILLKRGAVVATQLKRFSGQFGEKAQIGLVPSSRFAELLIFLRDNGAFQVDSSSQRTIKRARVVHTVTVSDEKGRHRMVVADPDAVSTPVFWSIMTRVRDTVLEFTEPIPFWDAMLLPDECGRLYIDSNPQSLIEIDGVRLRSKTPFGPIRAQIGKHSVRLTDPKTSFSETYEVNVVKGKTTSLKVELR